MSNSSVGNRAGILILLLVLCSCSETPTSPDFRYEGTWQGLLKNYYFTYATGVPLGSALTLTIGTDGTASAYGQRHEVYSDGTLDDRLEMHVIVTPDGAVSGYGSWQCSFTGLFGADGEGYVIGQLDARTGIGSGNLIAEVDGIEWHFPWKIERTP